MIIESHYLMAIILLLLLLISGCAHCEKSINILTDDEVYYYIPAGIEFTAEINGKMTQVKRSKPTWAVDAAYLIKVQEEANKKVFVP